MHTLSREVNELLSQAMATGEYTDADTLLLDALYAFLDHRDSVEAIQRGRDDVAAGRVRPWREAIDEAREKHKLPPRS